MLDFERLTNGFFFWNQISMKKDEIIYEQGMPAFGVYFLVNGNVKLYSQPRPGVRRILCVCDKPGMMIGTDAILNQSYDHSAKTLSKCRFVFLDRSELLNIPFVDLIYSQAYMLETLMGQIRTLQGCKAKSRLAQIIIDKPLREIHRYELAQLAGLSVEYTSRILSEWEASGLIQRKKKKIEILDLNAIQSKI